MKKEVKIANKNLFLIITILIVLFVIVFFIFQGEEIEKENEFVVSCETDSDCVKVQTTCCPCNAGGKEECVSASEVEFYEKKLSECPENLICTQVYNCKIKSCSCINGECVGNEE